MWAFGPTATRLDQTRTTAFADWHIQPRPGTDAALALGMMRVIVERGLHDLDFLRAHTVGWEKLIEERLPEYPLDRVEAITGIAAADVEKLALLYGGTKQSFIRLNWGIQRHDNGGMMTKAIKLLPVITGAVRGKGGVCMSTGGEMRRVDLRKLQRTDLLAGRKPRTINMIQLGNALNDPDLKPPIKALFCWNADPANCVPDTIAARKGLARKDLFTVVHDTFWSDTTAYADIVLPADTALEHVDLLAAYGSRLRHVHLHDNKGGRADLHLPLGTGSVDVRGAIRSLQKVGYDGTITLEVFTPDRHHLAYSRDSLQRIWSEEKTSGNR